MSQDHKTPVLRLHSEIKNIVEAMIEGPELPLSSPFSSAIKEVDALPFPPFQHIDKDQSFELSEPIASITLSLGFLSPSPRDRIAAIATLHGCAPFLSDEPTPPSGLSIREQVLEAARFLCRAQPFSSLAYALQASAMTLDNSVPILTPVLVQAIALTSPPDKVDEIPPYIDLMKTGFELACDHSLSPSCQDRMCRNWLAEIKACASQVSFTLSANKAREVVLETKASYPSTLREYAGCFILDNLARYKLVRQGHFLSLYPQDHLLAHAEKLRDVVHTLEQIATIQSLSARAQEPVSALRQEEGSLRKQAQIPTAPPSLPIRTDTLICK